MNRRYASTLFTREVDEVDTGAQRDAETPPSELASRGVDGTKPAVVWLEAPVEEVPEGFVKL